VAFTEDSDVLQTDPKRFAVPVGYPPGPILTIADDMAQEHLDLALLAALEEAPGADALSWMYTGQGFHYLEDVGNPIHTVQVGLYDFFVDGYKARLKMGLLSGGGYLGPMRSLGSIGIDILTSHHTLSEELTEKRVLEAVAGGGTAEAQALLAAMSEEDAALDATLDQALAATGPRDPFAQAITRALIDVSAEHGDDVYRATRAIAEPRYRREGVLFDGDADDPDSAVLPQAANAQAYAEFYRLQAESFRRVGTALRRWMELERQAVSEASASPEATEQLRGAVLDRLVRRQLAALGEAEARRTEYLANPPSKTSAPERSLPILLGEIGGVGLVAGLVALFGRVRRRRRVTARPA
jgi:hypothetical protein